MSQYTKTIIVDPSRPPSTIGAGIVALGVSGGTVIVEAGTYDIGGSGEPPVSIPSNVTLIGRGNVVVRVTQPGTDPNWVHAFTNSDHTGGNTNIVLSGFKIVVTCGNSGPYNSHLIFMQNVSDSVIEKITIEAPASGNPKGVDQNQYAILFYSNGHDCQRNTIRQSVIRDFGRTKTDEPIENDKYKYGHGIGFSKQSGATGICCDSVVRNNHVSSCFFNIDCLYAERIIILGNIFVRAIGKQITTNDTKYALNASLYRCKNITVLGNQLNDTDPTVGSHGIYPSGCEGLVIMGNVVSGNRESGIKPRFTGTVETPCTDTYYSIIGNVCNHNGYTGTGNGIFLQGLSEHMVIMGNSCVNNYNCGIRVQDDDHQDPNPKPLPAVNNLVIGNVAVLHAEDLLHPRPYDEPISIGDESNIEAGNLTGKL